MKQFLRRGAALGLALAMTVTAASASQALGWDLHTGTAPVSVGTTLTTNHFWSDTYSDLRTEHYVTYTPSADVTPTVSYGEKVTDRVTLTGMAQQLESQGKRVVSGLNGDWYVLSTGAPVGIVVTDGVVRAAGYYKSSWAIGFYADGTAFIAQNGLSMSVTLASSRQVPLASPLSRQLMQPKTCASGDHEAVPSMSTVTGCPGCASRASLSSSAHTTPACLGVFSHRVFMVRVSRASPLSWACSFT